MDTVKNREKANCEVYKEIEEVIRTYHLNNFSKNGKGQANELIEYLTSRRTFSNFIRKLWKNYEITNNMYKYTAMVTENVFITLYKKHYIVNHQKKENVLRAIEWQLKNTY